MIDVEEQTDAIIRIDPHTERLLAKLDPCYLPMVSEIRDALPAVQRDTQAFGKSSTQFKSEVLDITHPTPIRCLRQVLAEIEKTMQALRQNGFQLAEKELQARIFDERAERMDGAQGDLMALRAARLRSDIDAARLYVGGAIRKLRALVAQRDSLLSKIGKDHITEADVEANERREHVQKAFEQALCAAYAHNGRIDEGNHIYLCNLGINGSQAQAEIDLRLAAERKIVAEGKLIQPDAHYKWLDRMADKYAGLAQRSAEIRGLLGDTYRPALLTEGDGNE